MIFYSLIQICSLLFHILMLIKQTQTRYLQSLRLIKYQIEQINYNIKQLTETLIITIEDFPRQKRFTATIPKLIPGQDSPIKSINLFECFFRQYVSDRNSPKHMLLVEPFGSTKDTSLEIRFTFPQAPIKELRYHCSIQELQNPKVSRYKDAIFEMAEAAMKQMIKKYRDIFNSNFDQKIKEFSEFTEAAMFQLKQKEAQTLAKSLKIYELTKSEIQKEIQDCKQYLKGQQEDLIQKMHIQTVKMVKEAMFKMNSVEDGLIQCQKSQEKIYRKWQEIQHTIFQRIEEVKDQLYYINICLKQKINYATLSNQISKLNQSKILNQKQQPWIIMIQQNEKKCKKQIKKQLIKFSKNLKKLDVFTKKQLNNLIDLSVQFNESDESEKQREKQAQKLSNSQFLNKDEILEDNYVIRKILKRNSDSAFLHKNQKKKKKRQKFRDRSGFYEYYD